MVGFRVYKLKPSVYHVALEKIVLIVPQNCLKRYYAQLANHVKVALKGFDIIGV